MCNAVHLGGLWLLACMLPEDITISIALLILIKTLKCLPVEIFIIIPWLCCFVICTLSSLLIIKTMQKCDTSKQQSSEMCFNFVFVKRQNNLPLPKVLSLCNTQSKLNTCRALNPTVKLGSKCWLKFKAHAVVCLFFFRYFLADPPDRDKVEMLLISQVTQCLAQNNLSRCSLSPKKEGEHKGITV